PRSAAISSGSAPASSQTATSPRASSASFCSCQVASGTITLPVVGTPDVCTSSTRNSCQSSLTMLRTLMICAIDTLLERFDTDTLVRIDKAFTVDTLLDIQGNDLVQCHEQFIRIEGRANLFADAADAVAAATEGDLVELAAFLVDAEDADMTDMVVTTGVHAAGDIDIQLAEIVHVIHVIKVTLDRFGNRDRLGVGQ